MRLLPGQLLPGHAQTLGATLQADGVNFALAAPNAEAVELCLFDETGTQQTHCLRLGAQSNGIWHGFLPGAQAGLVYGWRVHGPWAPLLGQRFNPAKVLLDPYAREVVGRYQGQAIHNGHADNNPLQIDSRDNAAEALKARVVAELPPPLAGIQVNPAERVIYELHTKGFTALHPEVPQALRGSYAGLAHPAALQHLTNLGITTVCLMPVAQRADEVRLLNLGLSNYWGYSPIAWNAPEARYWSGQPGSTPRSEFKALVDALHQSGLEVILDVVYNHTAETDQHGPTLSLRGIDNRYYYHLDADHPAHYRNWTGCGNCVNLNQPLVLRTVMDSLRYWVQAFGVDGFRFDLAPVLARSEQGSDYRFQHNAAFLLAVAQDPLLCNKLLVAEPWDIGPGGYQLGQFPSGWLEWNDRFRDTQRSFWLQGDTHRGENRGALAQRLAGSTEAFAPAHRAPHSSVNFVTAHDGFTLADLVRYNERHNQPNGEHNRDGHAHNLSHNFGVEGPSTNPAIQAIRLQHQRALLACTVLALGTPMLLAGDDIGHSQSGNNNAYCQDNPTTWLNWQQADWPLHRYLAQLLRLRQQRRALQSHAWWQEPGSAGAVTARWLSASGQALTPSDWNAPSNKTLTLHLQLAAHYTGPNPEASPQSNPKTNPESAPNNPNADCLLLINASPTPQTFTPPTGPWTRHIDTHTGNCTNHPLEHNPTLPPHSLWLASASGEVGGVRSEVVGVRSEE